MAKLGNAFITGANAKIVIDNVTMAYCSDVSYNINVQTIPVETMGKYEVHANEPVAYSVNGGFSIVRYTNNAAAIVDAANVETTPQNMSAAGNGAKSTTLGEHLDPRKILASGTFDVEIHEKRDADGGTYAVFLVQDCRLTSRGMTLNKRGVMVDNYAFVGILAGDKDGEASDDVSNSSMGDDLT